MCREKTNSVSFYLGEGEEESYYLSDEDVESEQEDDRVPPALVPI